MHNFIQIKNRATLSFRQNKSNNYNSNNNNNNTSNFYNNNNIGVD